MNASGGTGAWAHFKHLPKRHKVLVVIAAPLWLPIAFAAWVEWQPL